MSSDNRWNRMWLWAPLTGLATTAVVLAVLLGWPVSSSTDTSSRIQEFTPRPDGAPPPAVRVSCLRPGGPGPLPQADGNCRRGDLLSLKAAPRPGERFLSAASLGPDGVVRWYFPAVGGRSLPIGSAGLASRGVLVGADHPPGAYRLFVLLSEEPLAEPLAHRALDEHRAGRAAGPRVLETAFDVLP